MIKEFLFLFLLTKSTHSRPVVVTTTGGDERGPKQHLLVPHGIGWACSMRGSCVYAGAGGPAGMLKHHLQATASHLAMVRSSAARNHPALALNKKS